MARDYWVESPSTGRTRYVQTDSSLRGSTRSARVDFADVTRKEASSLRQANEELERENAALRTTYQTVDYELRQCQATVPALETTVQNLEYENTQLRAMLAEENRGGGSSHHHHHREGGDRKLRHQNKKLRNENETLRERVSRLERDSACGGGCRAAARRLSEDVRRWKAQSISLDDEMERLVHKMEGVLRRNKKLEMANESAARQIRAWKQDVDYYQAILRRHGFATR